MTPAGLAERPAQRGSAAGRQRSPWLLVPGRAARASTALPCLPSPLSPAPALPPCRVPVKVVTVYRDETEVNAARPGENLRLRLSGVEEEDVSAGASVMRAGLGWAGQGAAAQDKKGLGGWLGQLGVWVTRISKHGWPARSGRPGVGLARPDACRLASPRPGTHTHTRNAGFVVSSRFSPVPSVTQFEAQVRPGAAGGLGGGPGRAAAAAGHWLLAQPPAVLGASPSASCPPPAAAAPLTAPHACPCPTPTAL